MKAGTKVIIQGLVKASQHNGKVGVVSKKSAPGEGRVGIKLDDGTVLAVKVDNLELAEEEKERVSVSAAALQPSDIPKQRTLKRDDSLLREFDGSPDPNVLALYYHFADRAFDCFNASEYNDQMLRYYQKDLAVKLVVPRKIGHNMYFLVGLQHSLHEQNTLCVVAFNSMRSFAGISMLIKSRCFACNRPEAPRCVRCLCACFCSETCAELSSVGIEHQKLCRQIKKSNIVVEDECVQLV